MAESITYTQAAKELEGILVELDSDRLDVDEIAVKMGRAKELIEICRAKVTNAQMAVQSLSSNPA